MTPARRTVAAPKAPELGRCRDDRVLVRRGELEVAYDPLEFWYGTRQVRLSPMEGALMELLMRKGRASWEMINERLREGDSTRTVRDVLAHRIRRKFAAVGAPDPIESVRGWGLRLRVGPGERQCSGLVIGGRLRSL